MLKTYKYTLIKYLKAPSTWVIFVVSCFIAGFLGGYLPYAPIKLSSPKASQVYSQVVIVAVASMTTFLSLFVSVFAGFKSATMFKDEVEDGTFLVMLSKPTNRSQIIFGKWLALQTTIALFTLSTASFFGLFTLAFDKGDQIKDLIKIGAQPISDNLFQITMTIWGILTLMGLIFSSIALLLSTKLSVGATIGISIAIGVFIPITSLITTLTKKREFESISSNDSLIYRTRLQRFVEGAKAMGSGVSSTDVDNSIAEMNDLINDPQGIYSLGLATGEEDMFKNIWPFDFHFQLNELSSFASEQAIPDTVRHAISSGTSGKGFKGAVSQNIAHNIDTSSILSNPGNDDYTYLIGYFKRIIPILSRFDDAKRTYVWKVFKDVLQKAINKAIPNTSLNTALSTIQFKPAEENYKEMIKAFDVHDTTRLNISTTTDFTDVNELKRIYLADQALAKKNSNNRWTYLGYAIDQQMPSDANLLKQWWIPFFEMSKEFDANKIADAPTGTNYVGHVKLSTLFTAMDKMYSGDSLSGDHPVRRDEYCRYKFIGYESDWEFTALIFAHSNTVGAFRDVLPKLFRDKFGSEDMATLSEFTGQFMARIGYIFSYFFDGATIAKFIKENSISDFETGNDPMLNELKDVALVPHKNSDYDTLRNVLRIAKFRPDLLVKTKTHKYVDRNWILITYLIIALLLVPTSYWVIRRQDYR